MEYFDFCDYREMTEDPTKHFEQKQVVNFDITQHECRGDPLQSSYKDYKTISVKDIKKYPNCEK